MSVTRFVERESGIQLPQRIAYEAGSLELETEWLCKQLGVNLQPANILGAVDLLRTSSSLQMQAVDSKNKVLAIIRYDRKSPVYYNQEQFHRAWVSNSNGRLFSFSREMHRLDVGAEQEAVYFVELDDRKMSLLDYNYFPEVPVVRFREKLSVTAVDTSQLGLQGNELAEPRTILGVKNPRLELEYQQEAVFKVNGRSDRDGIMDSLVLSFRRKITRERELMELMFVLDDMSLARNILLEGAPPKSSLLREELTFGSHVEASEVVGDIHHFLTRWFRPQASLPASSEPQSAQS